MNAWNSTLPARTTSIPRTAIKKKVYSKKYLNLQKRINDSSSKYWRKKADDLWSEYIKMVFDYTCAVKGTEPEEIVGACTDVLNSHHLITRASPSTRHAVENGMCTCYGHHDMSRKLSPKHTPIEWALWLEKHYPEKYKWVREHRFESVGKPDYKESAARLQVLIDEWMSREDKTSRNE